MTNSRHILLALMILILAAFNAFYKLGITRVEEWDEARRGIAAYEMLEQGSYAVHTYGYIADYWSLKPPLGLWLIAASYKAFGNDRFALRFPSAVSGILTVLLVILIASKLYGTSIGLAAGLVLATTFPFFMKHSVRAGEYDAPLALLMMAILYISLFTQKKLSRAALIGGLLGTIFLLKSFAVILPVIGMAMVPILRVERPHCTWREIGVSALVALCVILPWLWMRYQFDGLLFIRKIFEEDLVNRSFTQIEGHNSSPLYYIRRLFQTNLPWMIFGVASIAGLLTISRSFSMQWIKSHAVALTWIVVPLTIASSMQTRIEWYINPIYPPLAILLGVLLFAHRGRKSWRPLLVIFFLATIINEALIVRRISIDTVAPTQVQFILSLRLPPGSMLRSDRFTQVQRFVARVELGLVLVEDSPEGQTS